MQRRQVMKKSSMFVGMDVHQKSIDVTVAEAGHDGEVYHLACLGEASHAYGYTRR
jgi:hypothetical protein